MARLMFPDEGSRLVFRYDLSTRLVYAVPGAEVLVYADAAGTALADIADLAGVPIAGSTLRVNGESLIPLFLGPDGVDTLFVKANNGPLTVLYARTDDRIDQLVLDVTAVGAANTSALTQHVDHPDPHAGYLRLVSAIVGDGLALTYAIAHGFGTRRVTVQVFQTAAPYQQVFPTVELPDINTVRLAFSAAPAVGAYEVVVTG